jgi:manganese/zinc/iron transport system permease protein
MMDWASSALPSAIAAAVLLGLACGLLGTFVVVRRMALTGDMLSHAVLPGVVAGLSWSTTRNPLVVVGFAVASGVLGTMAMNSILRHTRLKPDAALALVLSVFFALGIAMISRLQPAGVHAFLYGQIAALDQADLLMLAGASGFTLLAVPAVFPLLRVTAFDPMFSRMLGLPVRLLENAFFFVLAVVIVVSMQAVGVILVTAMLVTPAVSARFWTRSLAGNAVLACGFGALGGVGGVGFSTLREGLPTGPLIALSVTAIFVMSAIFGTAAGWLPRRLRQRRERLRIRGEDILKHLWQLEEDGNGSRENPAVGAEGRAALRKFSAMGLLGRRDGMLQLTPEGRQRAIELVRAHRLWESYLTEHAAYKPDHVHDEAERVEHWIDASRRERIARRLGFPTNDPHGSPIPPEQEEES